MERVVIALADDALKDWEVVPVQLQRQLQENFEDQIKIVAQGIREAEFRATLDRLAAEAKKNGLTEEILAQLLKDE